MKLRPLLWLVLLATLIAAAWHYHVPRPPAPPPPVPAPTPDGVRFPPNYAQFSGRSPPRATSSKAPRWSWLDSGNVIPAHYPRRDFEEAPDLHRLALSVLDAAAAGSAQHAYLLYLSLDECHSFLRLDARSILTLYERMLGVGSELTPHEQRLWAEQFNRCVGFAVYDWQAIGEALGEGRPEVNVEFAGAWFQRAVRGGHPPALVESAFRPGELDSQARRERIHRALDSGDPEVYWLLFLQAYERDDPAVQATALPWLRLACESGLDCRFHAPWFQQRYCAGAPCEVAASTLAWFWRRLPAARHEQADARYRRLMAELEAGRYAALPLPGLPWDRDRGPPP